MNRTLDLKVVLSTIEKVTGPLKKIVRGSTGATAALKATRDQLRQVDTAANNLKSFRTLNAQLRANKKQIEQVSAAQREYTTKLNHQRTVHENIKASLQSVRNQYKQQSQALIAGKGDSEAFRREYAKTQARLTSAQQAFNKSAAAKKQFSDRLRHTRTQVQQLTRSQQAMTSRLEPLRNKLESAGISTRRMGQSARRLRADSDALNHSFRTQQTRLDAIAQRQRRVNQLNAQHSKTMGRLGIAGASGIGAVYAGQRIGMGAARLLAPGMEFDTTMSEVQALTRLNKNDPRLKILREHARELGANTQFSATQVGGGQAFLAMAGFTPKAIKDAMPGLLDMALAGGSDLARTADISSNILGGFKLRSDQMGMVADVLTKTFTTSNTTLEMLGETMKYVGPVASAAGIDLEQMAAMAGLLGNVGIQGSEGGTTLRAMLLRLSAPTGAAKTALDGLGMRISDDTGKMRDMNDILEDLQSSLSGLGETKQLSLVKEIFGERPAAGVMELLNAAGNGMLRSYVGTVRDNQGTAQTTARDRGDNLDGDIRELRSAWDDVRIQLMDENRDALRTLVKDITGAVRRLGEWAKANPETVKLLSKIAFATVALTTAMGALTVFLVSVLGPALLLRFILTRLGISVLPLVAKAAMGSGKALGLMLAPLRMLGRGILGLGKGTAGVVVGSFRMFASSLRTIALSALLNIKTQGLLAASLGGLKAVMLGMLGTIKTALIMPLKLIGHAILFVGRALLMNPIGLAITAIAIAGLAIIKYWEPIKAFFRGFWQGLMDGLAPLRESLNGLGSMLEPLKPAWEWFTSALSTAWEWVSKLVQPFEATAEQIEGATASGRGFGLWLGELITNIGHMSARFFNYGVAMVSGLIDGLMSRVHALKEKVGDITGWVKGWFTDDLDIHSPSRVFAAYGRDTMAGYSIGLQESGRDTLAQVSDLAKRIIAAGAIEMPGISAQETPRVHYPDLTRQLRASLSDARDLPDQFHTLGASLADNLADGLASGSGRLVSALANLAQWIKARLSGALQFRSHIAVDVDQEALNGYRENARGINREALVNVSSLTKRLTAGASLALGGIAALPVAANVQLDSRPPISHSAPPAHIVEGDTITINIYAAPGMDERAIAKQVQKALDERDRQKSARARGLLYDR